MSSASAHSTFKEQYPLSPSFTKWECTAPTVNILGILALLFEIFLSERTIHVLPSLTEVSASSRILSILSLSEEDISNVQSISFVFFEKNFLNFFSCEFVRMGLSKTYIFSSVKLSKSKILPRLPNLVFKLMTLFSLKESIGGLVT